MAVGPSTSPLSSHGPQKPCSSVGPLSHPATPRRLQLPRPALWHCLARFVHAPWARHVPPPGPSVAASQASQGRRRNPQPLHLPTPTNNDSPSLSAIQYCPFLRPLHPTDSQVSGRPLFPRLSNLFGNNDGTAHPSRSSPSSSAPIHRSFRADSGR